MKRCIYCNNEIPENDYICRFCGGQQQNNNIQVNDNQKNNDKKKIIIAVIISIILLLVFSIFLIFLINKDKNNENGSTNNSENIEENEDKTIITNTSWTASDGSELIFSKDRIDWYRDPKDHSDNYYSGKYTFYKGKEAVKYITEELSEYGITKEELQGVFDRSKLYEEDLFVVFDIRYDKYVANGENQKITKSLVPWYGFILDNNTYLDVANMNTGSYLKFSKNK